jgi:organic hydroperoxide reductase OsmC/OhrA
MEKPRAESIVQEAHRTCPYSKAMRGDANVNLVVE